MTVMLNSDDFCLVPERVLVLWLDHTITSNNTSVSFYRGCCKLCLANLHRMTGTWM